VAYTVLHPLEIRMLEKAVRPLTAPILSWTSFPLGCVTLNNVDDFASTPLMWFIDATAESRNKLSTATNATSEY